MFTDFYLQFPSEEAARQVLFKQDTEAAPLYQNIDVLGTLYQSIPPDATEGYQPAQLPGWHVNVRVMQAEDAAALEPFKIIPSNPRRVWG